MEPGARTGPSSMMAGRKHLLLYEPRTEGHHLAWLRFITEDLLGANYELSLAVDLRAQSAARVHERLAELAPRVRLLSAYDTSGRRHGDGKAVSVAICLRESGASHVFLCALDEIASHCWRRAALGLNPPDELRGRMGGIYHRPVFMGAPPWSPNRWLKQSGFRRVLQGGWLRPLLLVDPYLTQQQVRKFPEAPISYLPCPCPEGLTGSLSEARAQLQVPPDRIVFLFYGTGHRRKGLHLAVEAFLQLDARSPAFLLCVGQQNPSGATAQGLDQLVRAGRAKLLNRYVSNEEERLSFAASDVVLVPYLHHFGTSAVLYQAMAAGKPVIASDEQLLGRLTREYQLGFLFPSGNASALAESLQQALAISESDRKAFTDRAARFARENSRQSFRSALRAALSFLEG